MLFACLFLLFLQSACTKNLPGLDKVERNEQGGLGEEIPMKCQDEEECWLKYRVDRSSQAAKRENGECDDVPENEKTICNLFLGIGKRELNIVVPSLKESPARRKGLENHLTRNRNWKCDNYPFCYYSPPGKKKFMVKKAARETDHEVKVNAVPSSDTNDQECNLNDLLCSSNGGVGRKRSIRSKLDQDNCADQENSSTSACRWPVGGRRKRTLSRMADNRAL